MAPHTIGSGQFRPFEGEGRGDERGPSWSRAQTMLLRTAGARHARKGTKKRQRISYFFCPVLYFFLWPDRTVQKTGLGSFFRLPRILARMLLGGAAVLSSRSRARLEPEPASQVQSELRFRRARRARGRPLSRNHGPNSTSSLSEPCIIAIVAFDPISEDSAPVANCRSRQQGSDAAANEAATLQEQGQHGMCVLPPARACSSR